MALDFGFFNYFTQNSNNLKLETNTYCNEGDKLKMLIIFKREFNKFKVPEVLMPHCSSETPKFYKFLPPK
jgi:hypothetical protein